MKNFEKLQEFEKRFNSLKREHDQIIPLLQDFSKYISPNRGIFHNDRSRLYEKIDHQTLLSAHATHAARIASSGLQTGMTDPSRPWFRFILDDITLDENENVRAWLDEVQHRVVKVMNKSNIYSVLQHCYDEVVTFGTGCFLILEDYEDGIRGRSFTAGEYYLGTDNKGRVNSFAREFEMTVSQIVKEFGLESVSDVVKSYWENNQVDIHIRIRHLIEPNDSKKSEMQDFKNMPYRSAYWEQGNSEAQNFLAVRGYKIFPVIAPRWETTTTDMVYGYGPGHFAIGAIKELQKTRQDKLLMQSKLHNPPMIQDSSVEGHANLLPGGVTRSSSNVPNTGLRPAYQISDRLDSFTQLLEEEKTEIDKFFFVNVFLMLANLGDQQRTAFEIAKREQEKMMMLGPILHNLNEELHDPMIDLIYNIMAEQGHIPPPPQELEGYDGEIKIQYISVLAQAQRDLEVQKIQEVVAFAAGVMPVSPEAMDSINIDEAIRITSNEKGAPVKILRKKEEIDAIREQRQQMQNAQMAMQAAPVASQTAKDLASSPMDEDNALTRMMSQPK